MGPFIVSPASLVTKMSISNVVATGVAIQQTFIAVVTQEDGMEFFRTEADVRAWISCAVATLLGLATIAQIVVNMRNKRKGK